jgi:hypothetical protein
MIGYSSQEASGLRAESSLRGLLVSMYYVLCIAAIRPSDIGWLMATDRA